MDCNVGISKYEQLKVPISVRHDLKGYKIFTSKGTNLAERGTFWNAYLLGKKIKAKRRKGGLFGKDGKGTKKIQGADSVSYKIKKKNEKLENS